MGNGATPRVRRNVQSLIADGDSGQKVLDDYARAITEMRKRDSGPGDPRDPLSWRFQAAIHGYPGVPGSIVHKNLWGSCQHASWFFLPWHRLYLFHFERIVQFHLGDPSWSLPYWDYARPDESARRLPEPFRVPASDANPLYTDRRRSTTNSASAAQAIPTRWTSPLDALRIQDFALPPEDPAESFAGGVFDKPDPPQGTPGSLEQVPHGSVHGFVGGEAGETDAGDGRPGLMSRFETAGLDPIFWLHHANIDRLWDVWIERWGASELPDDAAWLKTEFEFFDSDGTKSSREIGDILVSGDLGYVYESTEPPDELEVPERREILGIAAPGPRKRAGMPPVRLIGAAGDVPFASRSTVDIGLEGERRELLMAARPDTPDRWYLRVEDVVGESPRTPGYDVYVNLPEDERGDAHPELRAGGIPSFGIPEASRPDSAHGGTGITDVFDITDVVATIEGSGGWDASNVKVTIVPVNGDDDPEKGGDVRARRISVYAG